MSMKKIFQVNRKLYPFEIYDSILSQIITEISIPGTSAKLFVSDAPLFIYLKHYSTLIPTFHLIFSTPNIIQRINLLDDVNSNFINKPCIDKAIPLGSIFSISIKNQFHGIGKVIKQNKKHILEIIFDVRSNVHIYIVEKYPIEMKFVETNSKGQESLDSKNNEEEKTKENLEENLEENIEEVKESNMINIKDSVDESKNFFTKESSDTVENSDEVLFKTAIWVLKYKIKKNILPVESSLFLSLLMKNRGEHYISVQNTSHKKLSVFLEYLATKKLISFKLHPQFKRKMITEINYDLLKIPKEVESSSESEMEVIPDINTNKVASNIEILVSLPIELCEIMHKLNLPYSYDTLYTRQEAKEILAQYLRVYQDCDRSGSCTVDRILSRAFSIPEGIIEKSYLFGLLCGMMIPKYFFKDNQSEDMKYKIKNSIIFVEIIQKIRKVKKFASVKVYVLVKGFQFYQVKAEDLCEKFKKCGRSVFYFKEDKIKIQGKFTSNLVKVFTDDFKIPMDFIKLSKS